MKRKVGLFGTMLAAALVLAAAVTCFAGCGAAKEELGSWSTSVFDKSANEFATMFRHYDDTLSLYSDNTYKLEKQYYTYVSTDGGDTYALRAYDTAYIYGSYEVTNTNEELNEQTVKLTDVTEVIYQDHDFVIENGDFSAIENEEIETVGQTLIILFGVDTIAGQDTILSPDLTMSDMFGGQRA